MAYVIAAIIVVLIVGGFVLFLVTNAARKSNLSGADVGVRPGAPRRDDGSVAPPVDGGEAEGRRSTR